MRDTKQCCSPLFLQAIFVINPSTLSWTSSQLVSLPQVHLFVLLYRHSFLTRSFFVVVPPGYVMDSCNTTLKTENMSAHKRALYKSNLNIGSLPRFSCLPLLLTTWISAPNLSEYGRMLLTTVACNVHVQLNTILNVFDVICTMRPNLKLCLHNEATMLSS